MKIQFRNLHFSYEKDREILAGIDLDMPAGAFISLVGESGCGKSTIAGILAGRNRGFSGSVTVNGTATGRDFRGSPDEKCYSNHHNGSVLREL